MGGGAERSVDGLRDARADLDAHPAVGESLVFSAGQCVTDGHMLGRLSVDASADLLDPATWATAKSPLPAFTSSPANSVYAPGHSGFFTSPDGTESWIAHAAYDSPGAPANGKGCLGQRELRIQPFAWNADGTPERGRKRGAPRLDRA